MLIVCSYWLIIPCLYLTVDGEWGSWGKWSQCSATCGPGKKVRRRKCNNPTPQFDGYDCDGKSKQKETCKIRDCPGENFTHFIDIFLLLIMRFVSQPASQPVAWIKLSAVKFTHWGREYMYRIDSPRWIKIYPGDRYTGFVEPTTNSIRSFHRCSRWQLGRVGRMV